MCVIACFHVVPPKDTVDGKTRRRARRTVVSPVLAWTTSGRALEAAALGPLEMSEDRSGTRVTRSSTSPNAPWSSSVPVPAGKGLSDLE